MKTLTVSQFQNLAINGQWIRTQDYEVVERFCREQEVFDEFIEDWTTREIPHAYGWACIESRSGDMVIRYTEGFNFDEWQPETLTTGTEGQDEVWNIEGFRVVDEDGDELTVTEIEDFLPHEFTRVDYGVLQIEQTIDVDIVAGLEDQAITLTVCNKPDIRFNGVLVGSVASSGDAGMREHFSGYTGRWSELALYKTAGGLLVAHRANRSLWQGDQDHYDGQVCSDIEDVYDFFGDGDLAKRIYEYIE